MDVSVDDEHGADLRAGPVAATARTSDAYRDFWESSPDGLFTVDVGGPQEFVVEGVNPALRRAARLDDVAGLTLGEILEPVSAANILVRFRQCVAEGCEISFRETFEFPGGSHEWRMRLTPVRAGGRIVRLLGMAEIVERASAAPDAIVASRFELNSILDSFPNHIALLDASGRIFFVNRAWKAFGEANGATASDVGRNYVDICAVAAAAGHPEARDVLVKLRALLAGEVKSFTQAYPCGERHFLLRGSRFKVGGVMRFAMNHQDVSEAVVSQHALAAASEHLLAVQEEERARIAMELHDSTSQHLVAVGLSIASLRQSGAPPHVLEDMRRSLGEAHREIRTLTYLLYPPKLSSEGLEATLRGFVEGFRRRTGLSIAATTFGPLDELPLDVQRATFRVIQESLANVHRHAQAGRVALEVTLKAKGLRITVVDDGRAAVNRPAGSTAPGVGIRGMRARVRQFDGDLTVVHRPFGTVVDAFLPRSGFQRPPTSTAA